jgi:hypothetical protein
MATLKVNGTIQNALKVISKLEALNSAYAEEFYNNIVDFHVSVSCLTGFGPNVDQTFTWSNTPQGDDYWGDINNKVDWS